MGQISSKLRSVEGGGLSYWCQGCKTRHMIRHGDGPGPRWGWDGNVDAPTFTPSVLVRSGHHVPDWEQHFPEGTTPSCWCTYNAEHPEEADNTFHCTLCHTFIKGGMVEFLSDCTHEFAGQTLPLPDLPGEMQD